MSTFWAQQLSRTKRSIVTGTYEDRVNLDKARHDALSSINIHVSENSVECSPSVLRSASINDQIASYRLQYSCLGSCTGRIVFSYNAATIFGIEHHIYFDSFGF